MELGELEKCLAEFLNLRRRDWDSLAGQRLLNAILPFVGIQCRRYGHSLKFYDVEDLQQDILQRIHRAIDQFQGEDALSFLGWIKRIARNCFLDLFRKEKKEIAAREYSLQDPVRGDSGLGNRNRGETLEDKRASQHILQHENLVLAGEVLDRLRESYPKRAQALDVKLAHPQLTTLELARLIGVEPANYYQLVCRARKACEQIMSDLLSEKTQTPRRGR